MKRFLFTISVVLSNYAYSCLVYAEDCVGISKSEPPAQITDKKLLFHSGPDMDNKYKYLSCGATPDAFLNCAKNTQTIGADGYVHKCTNSGWETVPFSDIKECENIDRFAQIYDAATGTELVATKLGLEYVLAAQTDAHWALKDICKYKLSDFQSEEDKCLLRGGKFLSYGNVCDISKSLQKQINITDNNGTQLTNVIITAINLNTPTKLNTQQDSTTGKYPIQIADDFSGLKFEFSKTGYISLIKTGDELIQDPNVILSVSQSEMEPSEKSSIIDKTKSTDKIKEEKQNESPKPDPNSPSPAPKELEEKFKSAQEALTKAKEAENSWANRGITAASTAATGLGAMAAASALAEKRADAEAEKQMRAYIETMKCEYGNGQNVKLGNEEITLPGGNELLDYYTEYKQLADNLKTTKSALGLRSGIESEVLYDRAQSGLYQYASIGKTGGAETSLYRALTDSESADATAWAEQKEKTDKKLLTGGLVAAAGVATGLIGNYLINSREEKTEKLKKEFVEIEAEVSKQFPVFIITVHEVYRPRSSTAQQSKPAATPQSPQETQQPSNSLANELSKLAFTSDNALFESGEYTLKDTTALDTWTNKISEILSQEEYRDSKICITTAGHTDRAQPRKKPGRDYSTNKELSEKRAQEVLKHVTDTQSISSFIDTTHSNAVGYGDTNCPENQYPNKNEPKCRYVLVTVTDCTTDNGKKMAPIKSILDNVNIQETLNAIQTQAQ